VNFEIFKQIKQSLIEVQDPNNLESRWIEEPKVLSQKETPKTVENSEFVQLKNRSFKAFGRACFSARIL
jgi:hypothetical protein